MKRLPAIAAVLLAVIVGWWWLRLRVAVTPAPPIPPTRKIDSPHDAARLFEFAADSDGLYLVTFDGGVAYFLAGKGKVGSTAEASNGPERAVMDARTKRLKREGDLRRTREGLASLFHVAGAGPLAVALPGPSEFTRDKDPFAGAMAWTISRKAWAAVGLPLKGAIWPDDKAEEGKGPPSNLFVFLQATIDVLSDPKEWLIGQSATDHQFRAGGSSSSGSGTSGAAVSYTRMALPPGGGWAAAAPEGRPLGIYRQRELLYLGKPSVELEQSEKAGLLAASGAAIAGMLPTNDIAVWDLATGKIRLRLKHPDGLAFTDLAFTADGKRLLAVSSEGLVLAWDAVTGGQIARISARATLMSPAADGSRVLAAGGDGTVTLWSLPEGERLATLAAGAQATAVALSPDSRRAAALVGKNVLVWDLE